MSQIHLSRPSLLEQSEIYESLAEIITHFPQKQQQLNLAAIAEQTDFNQYSIEQLFRQWGVDNPYEFLQNLSIESIKTKIKDTNSQLLKKQEDCLSQFQHRYQQPILLEVISTSASKTEKTKLNICYGIHPTPFGHCLIATTDRGICNLYFFNPQENHAPETYLTQLWAEVEIIRDQKKTERFCDRIFNPQRNTASPLRLYLKGTPFETQVWQALLKIPFAGIVSYQGLATSINRPTAARAIGNAIGNNPVAYLIPCHRVVRTTAEIGGYRWGTTRKSMILAWENWKMNQFKYH